MSPNTQAITSEIVAQHGLSPEEYERVLHALGREPNLVELGIFSVMWSEHCSYKSSRLHLKKLPTEAPWVICGPGENAGVIDIGDGQAAIFKMESHNHPSYIEPYQGAATGVGGILRDVFTMGARPIANANALRFGRPEHPRMQHLVKGVVAGIGGYGNCVGVPTVAGETNFHAAYDGNILVNAMTVGVADADKIFYSAATGVGNPIVYVGSKTGRDGIHGATMASADFGEDAEAKRPTVQVGDPFTEKLLIEACLELMATDAIVAIQDMGAAGLTSSSVEMATNGKAGIRLVMDNVPCREEGMTPYEMMLSESQERMLMVLKPGKEPMAEAIFRKWELDFAVIGEVTDTGHMVLEWQGEVVCDIPLGPLAADAPLYDRPYLSKEEYKAWAQVKPLGDIPESTDIGADLLKLMASPALASKRWIYEQYDRQVGGDTLQTGGDAGVVRVHGTKKALAITTDCTPRYVYADPYEGGKQAIAEAYRNLCAVGARPLAVTNCLNFANPQRPEIMAQLVYALEGMGDACRALDFPIVSGNVSLYNESKATGGGSAILPTPAIGGVGILEDYAQMMTMGFKAEDEAIIVLGTTRLREIDTDDSLGELGQSLGQSLWLREIHGIEAGEPPHTSLSMERAVGDFVRKLAAEKAITAVHDVSDGGVAVALAEMAMVSGIGANVLTMGNVTKDAFSEDQGRFVVTCPWIDSESWAAFEREANAAGLVASWIGGTSGTSVSWTDGEDTPVAGCSDRRPPRRERALLSRVDGGVTIRVGVGGWTYEPWRGVFYPEGLAQKRELEFAAQHLTAIEINATYYGRQKPQSWRNWAAAVPEGFVFSLKASRYCTARKLLAEGKQSIDTFLQQGFTELGDKLGPINWQLADGKTFDREDFARFLDLIPDQQDGLPLRHALEVRDASFADPAFLDLARARNMAVVFADNDEFPRIDEQTADFTYARLQGAVEDIETGYDAVALDGWAKQARAWAADARDVFVYFISGAKVRNPAAAQALLARLK